MHYVWKEWKENVKGTGLWLSFGIIILVSIIILLKSSALHDYQGFLVLLLNLFETNLYFIPILCMFLGAFSIFQEKEQKTLIMLLTNKDSYVSFLFKKSLAVQIVLIVPVLLWFIVYIVPLKMYFDLNGGQYIIFLASQLTLILIFTQLGIFIGSISRSRMQITGSVILLWFYLFFLHDFLLLSLLPSVSYENVKLFSLAYFINPFQATRVFLETGLGIYSFGHMSKLLKSFMWAKPAVFLIGNISFTVLFSFLLAVVFHRKEGTE
ncbi:ABC transporter permease subunit [Bacillus sp. FJAT-47783]|uniref:ABC transporter permease subunit n=1 Tax=Bacillus sp. FJAT-47783 TaxID=2922712 RepID=UPI001FAE1699|nr:ABC transporter permease subunit [Bacillus sp. FJAT-47783]